MEKLQRELENVLLDALLRNVPADKYAEIARMVLRYGSASKTLGEALMKERFLIKIEHMVDDECETDYEN